MRRLPSIVCCLAAIGACIAPGAANASPGDLDPTFAGQGFEALAFEPIVSPATVAAVGSKILVAANVATYDECGVHSCGNDYRYLFAQYLRDGSLDQSFGVDGVAAPPRGDKRSLFFQPMAITASGDIFAVGGEDVWNGALARVWHLDREGRFDDDFPSRPVPEMDLSVISAAPGNRVLLAGTGWPNGDPLLANKLILARIGTDGQLDPSFGDAGLVVVEVPDELWPTALSVETNGSVTVASATWNGGRPILVHRFDAGGDPVDSFGTDGEVEVGDPDLSNRATAITRSPKGGWLIADDMHDPTKFFVHSGALLELDEHGGPEEAFGQDGVLAVNDLGLLGDLAISDDGEILSSGSEGVMRLLRDGQSDPNYGGGDGIVRTPWMNSVASAALPGGEIARAGRVVDEIGGDPVAAVAVHGNTSGAGDSDADGVSDHDDPCFEIPSGNRTGCPQLRLDLAIDLERSVGWVSPDAQGSDACLKRRSNWRLVRRRGSEVDEYRLKNRGSYAVLRGWGRYRFTAPERLLPESGICPAARSRVLNVKRDPR